MVKLRFIGVDGDNCGVFTALFKDYNMSDLEFDKVFLKFINGYSLKYNANNDCLTIDWVNKIFKSEFFEKKMYCNLDLIVGITVVEKKD